jgi:anthranilate synthase component 1
MVPDYKEFLELSRSATLVPVVNSVSADLLTPVSAFLSIAENEPHAFLLESVERGEQIGRYTFLGARPSMRLRARGSAIEIERGRRRERHEGNVFQSLKLLLGEHRPAAMPGLPPFTAGAVGYFSYDVVRQLENIGEHAKDDLSLPDCELMFFDRLLAFDHLRHQIHIVAAADVSRESPRRAYDRAVRDIAALEQKLAAGLRPAMWRKTTKAKPGKLKIHAGTTRANFLRSVERAKEYIAAGDIFQVVLSQRLDFIPGIEAFDLYRALRQVNPSPYLYFLRMGGTEILGSSPEMLVRVTGRKLEYRPIAGTHPRGRDETEDLRLEQQMRNDEKERAEHVMLVDLGRNDLGRGERLRLGQGEGLDVCGALLPRNAPGLGAGRHTACGSRPARRVRRMFSRGHAERSTQSARHADYRRAGTGAPRHLWRIGAVRRFCREPGFLHRHSHHAHARQTRLFAGGSRHRRRFRPGAGIRGIDEQSAGAAAGGGDGSRQWLMGSGQLARRAPHSLKILVPVRS